MQGVMGAGRLVGGRYRLQDPIGRGAMGIVWRGRDELLARDVAVKEVQVTGQATPAEAEAIYQRTLREARTAARLSHPNVVKVFDVVEEGGSPWIIMELVEAKSLDRVITEDGPLPPEQAADLGAGLVGALAAAHASGVLHRDVKPSNVLVTRDGRAVLTDFGIATFAEDLGLTQAGMVVGTPGFTAPERIRGDIATPASDLWSLGATLYAAVEGRGPFDRAGGSSEITAGVVSADAPRAPSAGPLGPVIDALLSRDPDTRPDAATAERLLAEAATAARTGPRPLTGGWLAAEAGREPANGEAPTTPPIHSNGADSGFLDPPDYEELQIPAPDSGPLSSGSSAGSGERPLVAAALVGGAVAGGPVAAGDKALASDRAPAPGAALTPGGAAADLGSGPSSVVDPSSGPVLWGPVKAGRAQEIPEAAAEPGSGAPGAGDPGQGGGGRGGGGPAGQSSRRWRLMVAAGGIAALVVAAIVTWNIFQHSGPASALGSSTPQGTSVISGTGPSPSTAGDSRGHSSKGTHSGSGASSTHGSNPSGGRTGPGKSNPSGKPSATPSTGSSSGSGRPSPSASPTPSPSTSPPAGVTLPAGYSWYKFGPIEMDAVAGFKIGMPDAWTQAVNAPIAAINDNPAGYSLDVNLSYWAYATPLSEAQYLGSVAAKAHKGHGFEELLLSSVNFAALGGYTSASGAELKYSWNSATLGYRVTELVILVAINTSAGSQPYEFELRAPTATYGAARAILTTALPTFRPLPS